MAGVELGTAYLSLAASTGSFAKDVRRELGDVDTAAGKAGKSGGRRLSSGLATGLKVVGGAVAGVTALVGGLALTGGVSRALAIEDAQAKLKGLGHSTKSVEKIMDSALASVKGTAFGLGDAAGVAASAVAAGVKPGKDLTRTLSLIGDAATIAGTDMGDMGAIFNKVAGTGKIQGEVIAQLGERGIPILQLLSKELGVSTEDVQKLASQGKVSFADFQNAMESGMGGAALKSGETFRGSLANVRAALGRLGAVVATPALEALKGVFNDAIPAIDAFAGKIGPLVQQLADDFGPKIADASEKFFTFLTGLVSGEGDLSGLMAVISPLGAALKGFAPALAPLGEAFQTLGAAIGDALAPVLPVVVEAFTGILNAVAPVLPVIGEALVAAVSEVSPLFAALAPIITQVVQALVPLLPPIVNLVQQALPLFAQILGAVLDAVSPLIPTIGDLASRLLPILAEILGSVIGAIEPLLPAVFGLVEAFMPLLPVLSDLIATILPPLADLLVEAAGAVAELAGPLIELLAPILKELAGWWTFQIQVMGLVVGALGSLLSAVMPVVAALADKLGNALRSVVEWLRRVAPQIGAFVQNGVARIGQFAQSVREKVTQVATFFRELPGKIRAALSGLASSLASAGRNAVQGFINGVRGMAGSVISAIKSTITDKLPGFVKDALGIHSPSRVFQAIGRWIPLGLAKGITDSRAAAEKAMKKVTDRIAAVSVKGLDAQTRRLVDARKKQAKALVDAQLKTTKGIWRKGAKAGVDRLLSATTSSGRIVDRSLANTLTVGDFVKAREQVAKQVASARKVIADLRKERANLRKEIAEGIRGELDLAAGATNKWGYESGGKAGSFESVASQVSSLAARAKAFAQKLQKLVKAGIPAGLVAEVASLGTVEGSRVADALLKGSKSQIKKLSQDYSSLNSWSSKAGKYVSDGMFNAGIEAQKGLIKGLKANDKELEAAAKRLAKKLAKSVKKALGIKSPSRVFDREVGRMVPAGIIRGFDAMQGTLDRRTAALVDPSLASRNVNPAGGVGNGGAPSGRVLSDADIYALADVLHSMTVVAEVRDDRVAGNLFRRGQLAVQRLGGGRQ